MTQQDAIWAASKLLCNIYHDDSGGDFEKIKAKVQIITNVQSRMIMVFQDYKIEGDSITFTKKELQEAYEHFCKTADKFKPRKNKDFDYRYPYYLGKASILRDMLKMFEPIDFV